MPEISIKMAERGRQKPYETDSLGTHSAKLTWACSMRLMLLALAVMIDFRSHYSEEGARVALSVQRLGYGLDDRGSVPGSGSDGTLPLHGIVHN
jgi:hypothetical protein